MASQPVYPLPKLHHLPAGLLLEGAVRLELHEGLPVLRASTAVQKRITDLLQKQQTEGLSPEEMDELDRYEEMDEYLSFLNRVVRNLFQVSQSQDLSKVPRRRVIPRSLQAQVRRWAGALCEYCHTAEQWQYVPFTVDHIVPLARGGTNLPDNLALACFPCNRRKSAQTSAVEPESGETVSLLHPRHQVWNEHFMWSADGLRIVGITPIGRATIVALDLNRERAVNIRAVDIAVGRHPPADDRRHRPEQRDA